MERTKRTPGFRDHFIHIIETLKNDLLQLLQGLGSIVDDELVFNSSTRNPPLHTLEQTVKRVSGYTINYSFLAGRSGASGEEAAGQLLEPLLTLLNLREAVLYQFLYAILYRCAVCMMDIGIRRKYSAGGIAEVYNLIIDFQAKSGVIPDRPPLPAIVPSPGPYTHPSLLATPTATPVASVRLIELSKEIDMLDGAVRNYAAGNEMVIIEAPTRDGKSAQQEMQQCDLRRELTAMWKKTITLEGEINQLKSVKYTPTTELIQNLTAKTKSQAELISKLQIEKSEWETKANQLEIKNQELKRSLHEAEEQRSAVAHPVAAPTAISLASSAAARGSAVIQDQLERELETARKTLEKTKADSALLSNMYREQIKNNQENERKCGKLEEGVTELNEALKQERSANVYLREELKKKQQLITRLFASRESMHSSYLDGKGSISEAQREVQDARQEVQAMKQVLMGRDSQIQEVTRALMRASARVDELENQKKCLLDKFAAISGKSIPAQEVLKQFHPRVQ